MNPVVYFEMPADKPGRASEFYEKLFGWKIKKFEGEKASCGDYFSIETGNAKMALCGGIIQRQADGHGPTIYVGVPSVDEYAKKVEKLGGQICVEKMAVPKMGYFVCCVDTEGNGFAIWEDDECAKFTAAQENERT